MGDLPVCSRQPNGVVTEDRLFVSPLSPPPPLSPTLPLSPSDPDPCSIGEDSWVIAEQTTQEVVCCIHPTLDSEEKRKDVIEYVQRLIRSSLRCEVFPYGSVPLKTYLPDGDIDLTAVSSPTIEETFANDVLAVLQLEEWNENAEYEVKDTQFIDAEVKLVKCLVQNIVIDISFNQLGGLCTLCFLEQVDRLVAKDHLFKRSIILIKAWCYYESRILGAHHGLISTYALETLILYIFHLFHASLNGPLAVLYRFLDYFSKFDWENYCVSLNGPVSRSSLPDIVVEWPASVGDDLMLSDEFLRNCIDMFSVPSRGLETNSRSFPQKHLNIIDPLKENNNLGRSVHRGNFYRIRSAFKFGARKLGRILLLPRERIADEIKGFFANTLERHGHNSGKLLSPSHSRIFSEEKIQLKSLNLDLDNNIPGVSDNEVDRYSTKDDSVEMACSIDGNGVLVSDLPGEVSLRIETDTSDCLLSSCKSSISLSGLNYHSPSFYSSVSSVENGKLENGKLNGEKPENAVDEIMGFNLRMERRESHIGAGNAVCSCCNNHGEVSSAPSEILSLDATIPGGLALDFKERDLGDIPGNPETLNPFSDLSGDYDSHIRSLLYGQCRHGYAPSALVPPSPPSFPSIFPKEKPWDTVHRSVLPKQNACPQMNTNGVVLGPMHTRRGNPTQSNSAFCSIERHKPQGTGTYIPNTNGVSCRERSSHGRGRSQAAGNHRQFQRHNRNNNGSAPATPEKKLSDEGSHELRSPVLRRRKSGLSQQSAQSVLDDSQAAGVPVCAQKLEFGSLRHLPIESSEPASDTSHGCSSAPSLVELEIQSSKSKVGNNEERAAKKTFHLRNEDDFPPLTI